MIGVRRLTLALALAAVACTGGPRRPRAPLVDVTPIDNGDDGGSRLRRELELEVLDSYDRLALDATSAAAAIDPAVGLTAIGVGPGELGASSAALARWPVTEVDDRPVTVVSRALELHLAVDGAVGWTYDQISLHLRVCGRTATIPLRAAQVYVRDSERWTLVSEHLAYAQPMGQWLDAATGPVGPPMLGAIERQPESDAALAALTDAFAVDGDRARTWDAAADAIAIWPDPLQTLRGGAVRTGPSLAASLDASAIVVEGARLAFGPGRRVAIAATSLLATVGRDAGPVDVRLRATAVLERGDDGAWRVRQAMVSAPITPAALVARTVGVIATVGGSQVFVRCAAGPATVAALP